MIMLTSILRQAIVSEAAPIFLNSKNCFRSFSTGVRCLKRHKYAYLKELYHRRLKAGPPEPTSISKRLNWNFDAELFAFSHRISELIPQYTLQLAFTDKTYALQMKRLERELVSDETLTEAVDIEDDSFTSNIKLATAGRGFTARYIEQYLVSELPHLPQEAIRALVDFLTSNEKLTHVGCHLGMRDLVLYDGNTIPDEAVINSLLALIELIRTEQGVNNAQRFVRDFVVSQLIGEDLDDIYQIKDGMSQLTQVLAKQKRGAPVPRLIDQFGQETLMACYYVGIYSDGELIGSAAGESAETAKEMAARDALMTIYGIQDHRSPLTFNKNHGDQIEAGDEQPSLKSSTAQ